MPLPFSFQRPLAPRRRPIGLLALAAAAVLLGFGQWADAAAPPPLPQPFWIAPKTHKGLPAKLALSSDGRLLGVLGMCEDDGSPSLVIFDTKEKKLVFQSAPRTMGSGSGSLAFLPGGKSVVSIVWHTGIAQPNSTSVATVRVMDIPSGYVRKEFSLPRTAGRVSAVSPDGKKLVVSGDNLVFSVYDLATGWHTDEFTGPEPQPIANFPLLSENSEEYQARYDNRVTQLTFSPDSKFVAVGTKGGWTSVWNLGQRTRLWRKRVPHTTQIGGNSYYSQVGGLSFSPDGKSLASLARALTLFRVSDGASKPVIKEERIDSSPVPIVIPQRLGGIWVSFLADGKTLILWNGYTRFGFMGWDSSERRILGENWKVSYDRRKSGPRPPSVLQAVVSADRSVMVVERSGPIVEVWNLRNLWPR